MKCITTASRLRLAGFAIGVLGAVGVAHADTEGAAGGGLTPWALIGSNAGTGEPASGYFSNVRTRDYRLRTYGAALGIRERLEVSLGQQDLRTPATIALSGLSPFGVAPNENTRMQILGLKVRIAGDAVLSSDALMPQISAGVQYKSLVPGAIGPTLSFLGTKRSGTDVYLSATKLFLAQGLLVNATVRATRGGPNALPGLGAATPGGDSYSVRPEFSVAYLLSRDMAVGAEYRFKPRSFDAFGRSAGLGEALREDDWNNVYIAWAPSKNLSLTLAYVDLGRMALGVPMNRRQSGGYFSAQFAF
jgi:Protein of unknown function (DUF3034)